MLRPYQQRALDMLYAWFRENQTGNPCLSLPTGSGKSHVIAALVKDAVQTYPDTRILMLTHAKELITQNLEKLRQHWDDAPVGVYSASLRARELHQPITFAAIQSVRNRAHEIGHIDLCIVDEAHAINHTQTGGYRKLIAALTEINPALRVVGLTASPYRLGHGMIHEGDDALFDHIIEPVSIEELVEAGHLAKLRSKHTTLTYSTQGVKKSGGEFVAGELERAVNTLDNNEAVVTETIRRAQGRRSIIVFCAGVSHAEHIAELFASHGESVACVHGGTDMDDRDRIISEFKAGRIRIITNVSVLSTGFDHTGIDCVVFLRPTMSPGLYYQMAGRGLRTSQGKDDCLVLDFAGNVSQHGPITAIQAPRKAGKGEGEMATKECPDCAEILLVTARACPACGHEFTSAEKARESLFLRNDDILGIDPIEMRVTGWSWNKHIAKSSGKEMLRVTYFGNLSDQPIKEHFAVANDGYAGIKSRGVVAGIAQESGVGAAHLSDLEAAVRVLNRGAPPQVIRHIRKGGFPSVVARIWGD